MNEVLTKRSSFIEAIEYNSERQTLTVTFKGNGKRFRYYNVTPQKVAHLRKAPSMGSYYATKIKGQYERRRLPAHTK